MTAPVPPHVFAAAHRLTDGDAFIEDHFTAKDLEIVLVWLLAHPGAHEPDGITEQTGPG